MKISIGSKIVEGPWGGGNLFAINLTNFLSKLGHDVIYDLSEPDIDLILLTDPRSRSESSSTFNHIEIKKYIKHINPKTVVVQRINECDERKNTTNINQFYLNASDVADHVVFVSEWLREIYIKCGMSEEKTSVIYAGANSEIFNSEGFHKFKNDEIIKIVTHHWSSHANKGFKIYKKIDDLLVASEWKDKISFTYIGNTSEDFIFNKTTHEKALNSINWIYKNKDSLKKFSLDSIGYHLSMAIYCNTVFVDNQEEYRGIQNSGLIELIENEKVVEMLQNKYIRHEFIKKIEGFLNDKAVLDDYFIRNTTYSPELEVFKGFVKPSTMNHKNIEHHTIKFGNKYKEHLDDIFNNKKLNDDISYYLHRPSSTDKSMAPEGNDCFYVLVPVPNNQSNIDWSIEGEKMKNLVIDKMQNDLMPNLKENIVEDFYLTPDYFEKDLNTKHGSGFSIQPKFSQSAYFRFHNKSEVYDGLYFVGAGTHPGAGVPGVLSSAKVLDKII